MSNITGPQTDPWPYECLFIADAQFCVIFGLWIQERTSCVYERHARQFDQLITPSNFACRPSPHAPFAQYPSCCYCSFTQWHTSRGLLVTRRHSPLLPWPTRSTFSLVKRRDWTSAT